MAARRASWRCASAKRVSAAARFLLLAACLLAGGAPAEAHKTNLTTGRIVVDGAEIRYRLTVSAHDLAVVLDIPTDLVAAIPVERFAGRLDLLREYLDEKLLVAGDGAPCARTALTVDYRRLPDDIVLDLDYACAAAPQRLLIAYRLFFGVDPGHRAIGTIDYGSGREEYLLDRSFADIDVHPVERSSLISFGRTFALGLEHILIGIDHVLFIVALLLGGGRFWNLVRIVTAFTVAHSLTLSLAWFGVIDLPARLVESLIAASIAYVALENTLGRGMGHRWLLAFGFGLVHGLGFYGVLSELDLDPQSTVMTLLAFNLGVEAGQLAIVGVLFPLLAWATSRVWYRRAAVSGSLAILLLALFWLVERAGVISG
jgi:hypothetical protein